MAQVKHKRNYLYLFTYMITSSLAEMRLYIKTIISYY